MKDSILDLLLRLDSIESGWYKTTSGKKLTTREYLEVVVDFLLTLWLKEETK